MGLSFFFKACRGHCVHAPSQWEIMLECSIISHWLGTYTKWWPSWMIHISVIIPQWVNLQQNITGKHRHIFYNFICRVLQFKLKPLFSSKSVSNYYIWITKIQFDKIQQWLPDLKYLIKWMRCKEISFQTNRDIRKCFEWYSSSYKVVSRTVCSMEKF